MYTYVYVYTYIYVYILIYKYVYTYIYTHTCISTYRRACIDYFGVINTAPRLQYSNAGVARTRLEHRREGNSG